MDRTEKQVFARVYRHEGKSLTEIAKVLEVSLSTAHSWTRGVTLTPEQQVALRTRPAIRTVDGEQEKWCGGCESWVSTSAFTVDNTKSTGLRSHCGKCRVQRKRELKYALPGMSIDELLESQSSTCAICKTAINKSAAIDHDHVTGVVRGMLCRECNLGLGLFKDNPAVLKEAAKYVERFALVA
jgi:hypothetical protein